MCAPFAVQSDLRRGSISGALNLNVHNLNFFDEGDAFVLRFGFNITTVSHGMLSRLRRR